MKELFYILMKTLGLNIPGVYITVRNTRGCAIEVVTSGPCLAAIFHFIDTVEDFIDYCYKEAGFINSVNKLFVQHGVIYSDMNLVVFSILHEWGHLYHYYDKTNFNPSAMQEMYDENEKFIRSIRSVDPIRGHELYRKAPMECVADLYAIEKLKTYLSMNLEQAV